jgi:predicted  nucleic acid-binding Zn ribbon protein
LYGIECRFWFDPRKTDGREFWSNQLSTYIDALRKNGQILTVSVNPFLQGKSILLFLSLPAKDGLSKSNHNARSRSALSDVLRLLKKPPIYKHEGTRAEGSLECKHSHRSMHILLTNLMTNDSPLVCGDCSKPVPLFRLPYPGGKDFHEVLRWVSAYQSCEELYLDSGFGERFAWQQMSTPNSELTRRGRTLCKAWESIVRKPFYYYLPIEEPLSKANCPGCNGQFANLNQSSRFKHCKKCRLATS